MNGTKNIIVKTPILGEPEIQSNPWPHGIIDDFIRKVFIFKILSFTFYLSFCFG